MITLPPELLRLFQFEDWPRPNATDIKFFFWRLVIGPQLLPGWQLVNLREESLKNDARYTMSVWKPRDGNHLLRLDVYEERSRNAAEHRLLELLAASQSPNARRDDRVKYPLFQYDDYTTVVFSRGNLTFFVANAEREKISLKPLLADLEKLYTLGPTQTPSAIVPRLTPGKINRLPARTALSFTLEADYPLPCWYRIETKLGEVHREGERLIYQAPAGVEKLVITVVGTDGQATRLEHTFPVEEKK